MASRFSDIKQAPPIEVFAVSKAFTDDTHEKKVNLSVGAYRTNEGKPWVLPVVRKVEADLTKDETLNHEYLPILGLPELSAAATRIVLGEDSKVLKEGREGKAYRYWDEKAHDLDFEGMIEDLKNAPENSVIILHSCAHNPTGMDPTHEQWQKIADVVEEKKLFPLFDSAYQGFASGDLDNDAWAIRYFADRGFEMIITQSFAKNFGLYNERIGNLTVVVKDPAVIIPMRSQITLLVRGSYSNPPNHGARVVSRVLNDSALFEEWKVCIKTMSSRIKDMRAGLQQRLEKLGTPGTWDHITKQIGMFSYTGLSAAQAKYLAEKYHIYLLSSGRINMCGVNTNNIDYVASSIDDAVRNVSG
ncbi:hypothetical protein Avbf_07740 [Armadillidium vulgare]|nr:hypothetical protein Avbf_07740 [Armadillidium vulgare]